MKTPTLSNTHRNNKVGPENSWESDRMDARDPDPDMQMSGTHCNIVGWKVEKSSEYRKIASYGE